MTKATGRSPRVLVLVQNLPVPFDRRVWQECQALRDAGYDVTVISPSDRNFAPTDELDRGIRVLRYPAPPEARGLSGYLREYTWSLLSLVRYALRARRRGKFQVVHFCNPPDLLFLVGMLLKALDRSRLVFDQHDLGPELVSAKGFPGGRALRAVARGLERCTYGVSDHVISTNESYREIALTRGRMPAECVTVVRSGPPRSWGDDAVADETWRQGRKYLVGYLGVMGRQEGIDYLLEALAQCVHENGEDVQLALVGSGPEKPALEETAARLGLGDHVSFLGRVPDQQLKSVLATADVCVNADEMNELNDLSTMNKILEYMALGRPIVQFDLKEGRYSAGGSSLYARPNDSGDMARCIATLLSDRELAHEMGAEGRRRFQEHLAWEPQAERLVEAYARIAPLEGATGERGGSKREALD